MVEPIFSHHAGRSVDPGPVPPMRRKTTRRQFLMRSLFAVGALGATDAVYETSTLDVTQHRLPLRGLTQPCRLVQLSDLHRSWCVTEAFIARIVERTNALRPDLVLLTGDFVTAHSYYIHSCANALRGLKAPLGSYAVLGNHDYKCDGWQGSREVVRGLKAADVEMLTNRNTQLSNGLRLIGIDDHDTGDPDPARAFHQVKHSEPIIAMTHNPLLFRTVCAYDAVFLAGHTHGGQIALPIVTQMFTDDRIRYLRGWFREAGWPGRLYVSRGLGVITAPLRINSMPEIAVFDLVPA